MRDKFVDITPSVDGEPLRSEVATTTTLGLQGELGACSVGLVGWSKRQSNLVYEVQPAYYANGAVAKGRGIDTWVEWRLPAGWMSRLQYSWSQSRQRNPVMFRRNVLAGDTPTAPRGTLFEAAYWFNPVQDLRHQVTWNLGLQRGGWQIGSQVRMQSGRPWTPVAAVITHPTSPPVGVEGRRNSARLPAYLRVDARVARHFRGSRLRWNVYAEVLNLTGARNIYQYRYDSSYQDLLGIMMLPALPTLGFEAQF
jgi:hypothetical protein